ncbi:MAG: DUF4258 domain-containing protein [Chitinophagales bacterium]|nr:DUF4258 domain-containing protein [Chitinophagales bacterium]MDW8418757.1 DUF4258 domain-containing protein [Chitinophagales bacterium]
MHFTTFSLSNGLTIPMVISLWLCACEPSQKQSPTARPATEETAKADSQPAGELPLTLTRHARCRMDCRNISEEEIRYVLARGKVNARKSDPAKKPCPVYAYEARTPDRQLVRVVVAQCETEQRVITCIDLENEYDCACY